MIIYGVPSPAPSEPGFFVPSRYAWHMPEEGMGNKAMWYFAAVLCFFGAALWLVVATYPHEEFSITFLDIGQGDAIFMRSGRTQLLIDGGPDRSVLRELGAVMPFWDRTINVMLATHPDRDHIAGLMPVLERYQIGIFIESGVASESSLDDALEIFVMKEGSKKVLARRGMVITLDGGARFEILFPDRDPSGMETNTASIVGKLTYGSTCFILTGDSPIAIEDYLLQLDPASLDCDVLKAGHHGSRTSSDPDFVGAVSPAYTVISAGNGNSYGHPHVEVLSTLAAAGSVILETAKEGRITFVSDGRTVMRK
jgi:competence protein ComEC